MNQEALKQRIEESGIKKITLAKKIGISRQTLDNKLNGKSQWYVSEIRKAFEVLGIDDYEDANKLLFNPDVD